MGMISTVTLPDGSLHEIGRSVGAEYIRGTWTAATNAWTGVSKDSQLYDGKEIVLYLPFAGNSSNTTLNLTLNGGTGPLTGAKNVYFNSTTRHTTHYGQYQMVRMVYHASHNIAGTNYEGWWMDYARDTNDTAHNTYYYYSSIKAHSIIYRYQVCVQMQDGSLLPIASVDNKYNDTSKVLTTESFLPTGLITYYNSSGNTAAGAVVQAGRLYDSGLWDLRYSFNEGSTLTANTPVYMVTLPQGNGLVKLDADPIAQALPSTDDGKLYIYLGGAYDTYRIHAYRGVHPVFWYKNGGIRPYPETGVHLTSPGATNQLLQSNGSAEPEWSDSIYIDSMNTGSLIVRGNSSFVSPINGDISGNAATASSVAWGDVTGKPSTFAPSSHTHDDRYYTEAEIDTKLSGVATSGHTHAAGDIVSGKLPVNRGGTGLDTLTSGQVLVGNGTDAVTLRPIDTTSGGTNNSTSLITSGAVYSGLAGKANTSHNHNASDINAGTLAVARGGTGQATLKAAANSLIGSLDGTAAATGDWTDNTVIVTSHVNGPNGTYYLRAATKAWAYINSKAAEVYVPQTRTVNSKALSSNITLTAADVGAANADHSHDDRYYTETETDTLLGGKSDTGHKHAAGDITSGTLAPDRGGTGNTSLNAAANALINSLTTGSSAPSDNDYYVSQYAGGGTSTTTFHRRPVSALWTYMKGKADSVYVKKAGDTMTGSLILKPNQYLEYNSAKTYGLHANNSDICGLNGLYFGDTADSVGEGINFYRDATHWDSFRANSGKLQFNPNRTNEAAGTWYDIYHTNNKPSKADVGLGNVENKSSATIRGELTSSNVTTALGYTPADASAYLPLSGGELTGDLSFSQSNTTLREIRWKIGGSDYARIAGGATASNSGYLELATADDGNEPIYVRQYSGIFATLKRTATLLDASGNTSFPGALTVGSTVTATQFNGSVYTNNVVLQSYQRGTSDVAMFPVVDRVRANRLAFLPADQIIIENTVDGGETWTDAGYSDAQKAAIFATSGTINIPRLNNAKSELCGVRITITGMKYDVPADTAETEKYNYWNSSYVKSTERYFQFERAWFWVSANNDTIGVTVQSASGANPNSWTTRFDNSNFTMTGWSGADWVKLSSQTFGGGTTQTGNHWNWRFTFYSRMADGKTAFQSTTVQSISIIKGYGASVWTYQNQLMYHDHIYSYDASQNVTFPANITTTGTIQSEKLIVKGATVGTNTYADTNPKIAFMANDGQHGSLTWTSYDAVQSPASLTLNGTQGNEYFIAPNIKATGSFYGALSGNATSATEANKLIAQTKITTTEGMDSFHESGKLKFATFGLSSDPGLGFGNNDGLIVSIPWNANYGAQIAFDDSNNRVAIRTKNSSSGWRAWDKFYHTGNKPTKSDVGLGNVENKSSATIRGELTSSNVTTALGYTPADASAYLPLVGGEITGDVTLKTSGSGATPGLIFQRGTLTDSYNDWKIYDSGGLLYFGQRGSGSSAFDTTIYMDNSGGVHATKFTGELAGNATSSSYLKIVATNEIRFDVSTKPASAVTIHIGHAWSDGSKDAKISRYLFKNGNAEKAEVEASTFIGALTGHASEDLALSGGQMTGNITWKNNTALPQFSGAPTFLLGIEAFADGGATKWQYAKDVKVGEATKATQDGSGNTITSTYKTVASLKSKGGQYQPIYFDSSGNAQNTTYTLNKTVPSDAVFTDTKNTAGSTNSDSKLFLIGATSQAANPQTYSDADTYVTNGALRTGSLNLVDSVTLAYNATQNCLQFNFA